MIWQDLVFALGMIALTLFLIPAVRSATHKPPLATSLGHGSVMVVFMLTYATLHFWFATAMAAAEGALWFWLATQHGHVKQQPWSQDKRRHLTPPDITFLKFLESQRGLLKDDWKPEEGGSP